MKKSTAIVGIILLIIALFPEFSSRPDESGIEYVVVENNKFGILFQDKYLVKPKYDFLDNYSEGLMRARKDGKWGFLSHAYNSEQIKASYDYAKSFSEGLAAVKIGNKWGYIDAEGDLKIDLIYDFTSEFKSGNALVFRDNTYFFINSRGEEIIKTDYSFCSEVHEDAIMAIDGGTGDLLIVDYGNNLIANFGSDAKEAVGYAKTPKGDLFGIKFLENESNVYRVFRGDELLIDGLRLSTPFFNGIAGYAKEKNGELMWGLLDYNGIRTEPIFNNIIINSEGARGASLIVDGEEKFGFINTLGEFVIEPVYDMVGSEIKGNYPVALKDESGKMRWGIIKADGKEIVELKYDYAYPCEIKEPCINQKMTLVDMVRYKWRTVLGSVVLTLFLISFIKKDRESRKKKSENPKEAQP